MSARNLPIRAARPFSSPFSTSVAQSEARVATVEYPGAYVVIVYCPNSGDKLDRLAFRTETWDPALLAYLRHLGASGKRVLVAGDFNAAHLDIDIWNGDAKHVPKSAGTTPQERASRRLVPSHIGRIIWFQR